MSKIYKALEKAEKERGEELKREPPLFQRSKRGRKSKKR